MNTTRLTKHYSSLSVIERLRMIYDADKRGDAIESRRVADAAPIRYSMSDTGKLETELKHLATFHNANQLELAAEFWLALTQAAWAGEVLDDLQEEELSSDDPRVHKELFWTNVATCVEARYVIERDGWKLFIQQSGLDASRIDVMPKNLMLEYMNEHAIIHPNTEVALRWITKQVEPFTLKTPESVAAGWFEAIKTLSGVT